ncbi:hypothetical protein EROM_091150 [Encephalitozoon romaleae SJ-2008]|uniref:Uncharacterized protein n=1 Tax=Encephalitozoon romaleae (strain SJ-2008) TaxID=1178016 RepID=I6ZVH2_ENCRO|nr:hypothetical protein EROM_091150 [Encephalitozoon romaleae SJ-2008]AFN83731.1 hypothetical protein EROM_091150 [Encephalitozoon romaleae SJ-2008]
MKHMEDIKKARMREKHFRMKDKGYFLSLNMLGNNTDILSVFLGYIEGLGVDKRNVYSNIADAVLDGNNAIVENLRSVLKLEIRDEVSIVEEITKTH